MELHLKITGSLLILLSVMHIIFPRYFEWKKESMQLSLVNRQILYVHTFFIALGVLLIGLLCVTSAKDVAGTSLGRTLSLGLACFWGARLFVQFFGYSSKLWRGRLFETVVHVGFAILWTYLTTVFLLVYLSE